MIELNTTKQDSGYIPYPLRYKEEKADNKKLLLTASIMSSVYLLFITVIGIKLGFL